MSDLPDYLVLVPDLQRVLDPWPGFPHRMVLLPAGVTLDLLRTVPSTIGTFLVEPGSIGEVLNGAALPAYLAANKPILVHARRARDLRPLLRRASSFKAREVLP